jgi:prepilin-type N-terminal cleavage/methylation domain-containing protein
MPRPNAGRLDGYTLLEIIIVVVAIGLLATMAVPQYMEARARSQDTAILNNMRQLAAASGQYFLQQGTSVVNRDQLIGSSNYLKEFLPVAGESYPACYTQDEAITVTKINGTRVLSLAP